MFTDLSAGEAFFIETLRRFDFLRTASYFCDRFTYSAENVNLRFQAKLVSQDVSISYLPHFRVVIRKKSRVPFLGRRRAIELDDVIRRIDPSVLDRTPNTMEARVAAWAEFIQKHLMPVINGEVWIDGLLRQT